MTAPEKSPKVTFDPFSDEYFNDPYDIYLRMQDEAPVYYNEEHDFYALTRHADVAAALAAGIALPLLGQFGYAPGGRDEASLQALTIAYCLLPCLLKLGAGTGYRAYNR